MTSKLAIAHGFTLIEFVVSLVVLGLGSALLLSFVTPVSRSADPMIQAQARAIASAYMDEILLREYGTPRNCVGNSRDTWETIWCYGDELPKPHSPANQFGQPLTELEDYRVTVNVSSDSPAIIQVDVIHTSGRGSFNLQSARGNY